MRPVGVLMGRRRAKSRITIYQFLPQANVWSPACWADVAAGGQVDFQSASFGHALEDQRHPPSLDHRNADWKPGRCRARQAALPSSYAFSASTHARASRRLISRRRTPSRPGRPAVCPQCISPRGRRCARRCACPDRLHNLCTAFHRRIGRCRRNARADFRRGRLRCDPRCRLMYTCASDLAACCADSRRYEPLLTRFTLTS